MHEHDAPSDSTLVLWTMRVAVVVFAGLGILELAVATIFHKVALGVDGAHNLIDGLLYIVNIKAPKWAKLEGRGVRTCFLEPGSTTFTSGVVVVGAISFTTYEATRGGGTETHQLTALVLLLASLLANVAYTAIIMFDKSRRFKRMGIEHSRQLRNVLAHAFWDMVATGLSVVGYVVLVFWTVDALDPVIGWLGVVLIIYGHRKEIPDGWRQIIGHMKPGHPHPLELAGTHHHHDGHTEPGHSHH